MQRLRRLHTRSRNHERRINREWMRIDTNSALSFAFIRVHSRLSSALRRPLLRMDIFTIFRWVSPHFRRRRMKALIDQLKPGKDHRILDVGGYPEFWAGSGIESCVTILNLHPTTSASNDKI